MKIVCGIEISGSTANIVILEGKKSSYSLIKSEVKQLKLEEDRDQTQVKTFHETIEDLLHQNNVEKLAVRRPSTSGKFTASPAAFKIEAILQLGSVPVELLHSTKISSIMKKNNIPDEKYEGLFKYQKSAFDVAFCGLED